MYLLSPDKASLGTEAKVQAVDEHGGLEVTGEFQRRLVHFLVQNKPRENWKSL